ncbi:hypothetical protein [Rivularia sp. UHCC 0363]|uniref:hypothetical protein n=1 Tax=Rivularia sp. UHCC 0363 TaxID=3110244 RepID=UPI002B208988|nr:hypothetical protein [Rivularia sp. UHCC 0363]MEA5593320.1 hypothetical protein [Rivularia sp. UHCC 0363]
MRYIKRNRFFLNRNQPYYDRNLRENNIYDFDRISKKSEAKSYDNEIFLCIAIATLLVISFGGNHLIQNRTKQHLIYNSIDPISTTNDY